MKSTPFFQECCQCECKLSFVNHSGFCSSRCSDAHLVALQLRGHSNLKGLMEQMRSDSIQIGSDSLDLNEFFELNYAIAKARKKGARK